MPSGVYKRIKPVSKEARLKMSLASKGKPKSNEAKQNMKISRIGKQPMLGKHHSKEAKIKMVLAHKGRFTGENHPNWKGGISRNKHGGRKCIEWRLQIFGRDNFTCQGCGIRGCYLEAHHIKSWAKYPELRFELSNGQTLCLSCHKLTDSYKGKNNANTRF